MPGKPKPKAEAAPKVEAAQKAEPEPKPRLDCAFYKAGSGVEPVRVWLLGLTKDVRGAVGSDIERVQWRWPISMPLVGSFGEGLFEVRTSHDGNIYRVFFMVEGSTLMLLHAFTKKTQKTPDQEIATARKRQKEVQAP